MNFDFDIFEKGPQPLIDIYLVNEEKAPFFKRNFFPTNPKVVREIKIENKICPI